MASIGFTMPFARSSSSLGLFASTITNLSAAKEDLRSLALTNWGDRPMHFDMGFNLKEFLFEQFVVGQTDSLLEERIRGQISKWLPFLAVNSISVSSPAEHVIRVSIAFSMISDPASVDNISVEASA